jgi:hypothetical protein
LKIDVSSNGFQKDNNNNHYRTQITSGANFGLNILIMDYQEHRLLFERGTMSNFEISPGNIAKLYNDPVISRFGLITLNRVTVNMKPGSVFNFSLNLKFFEQDHLPFILQNNPLNELTVEFNSYVRLCIQGEIFIEGDQSCEPCPDEKYSLIDPSVALTSIQCISCPENAECKGGAQIRPLAGFWRSHENSSIIVECLARDACHGAVDMTDNLTKLEGLF